MWSTATSCVSSTTADDGRWWKSPKGDGVQCVDMMFVFTQVDTTQRGVANYHANGTSIPWWCEELEAISYSFPFAAFGGAWFGSSIRKKLSNWCGFPACEKGWRNKKRAVSWFDLIRRKKKWKEDWNVFPNWRFVYQVELGRIWFIMNYGNRVRFLWAASVDSVGVVKGFEMDTANNMLLVNLLRLLGFSLLNLELCYQY